MTGIKITYSWGDEEPIIECKEEDAWNTILDLVFKEVKVSTVEGEANVDVLFNYDECEATLHYWSDDEYCYHRFVKTEEPMVSEKGTRTEIFMAIRKKIEEAMRACNEVELDLFDEYWFIYEYVPSYGAVPLKGFDSPLIANSVLEELGIDIRNLCDFYDISYCG